MRSTLFALTLPLAVGLTLSAKAPGPKEIDEKRLALVEAGLLYRFCLLTRWPGDAHPRDNSPLIVGIHQNDRLFQTAQKILRDKKIGIRSIHLRKLRTVSLESIQGCHVLYIGQQRSVDLKKILECAENRPVLTVAAMGVKGFCRHGGIIGLRLSDKGKVVFEVNAQAAKQSRLKLSSKLLRLGSIIETEKQR